MSKKGKEPKREVTHVTWVEIVEDVIRARQRQSKVLFGTEVTQTGMPNYVAEALLEETGEIPDKILDVEILWGRMT